MEFNRRAAPWRVLSAVWLATVLGACGINPESPSSADVEPATKLEAEGEVSEFAVDPYADAVVQGGVIAVLNPNNAVGAPDGQVASFIAALGGSLNLDMGEGEEGSGPLRIHYRGLTVAVVAQVEFLRADMTVITTGQVRLVELGLGTYTALVPYTNATPYRFVKLKGGLAAVYQVDAVEATGPFCGDGKVVTGEGCDDGDRTGGDGCSATCQVEPGYSCQGQPSVCTDVNECTNGTSQCSTNATCTNIPGGYTCACKAGYTGNGRTCTDVNECTNGTSQCSTNATCSNTAGSYTCACKVGYSGDGRTCTDVNECTNGTSQCSVNATCTNTAGSYTCACKGGYTGNGRTCNDVNECTNGTAQCSVNATCTNTAGSFTCTCKVGYSGNGRTCNDINECTNGTNTCTPGQRCVNQPGGFDCVPGSCPPPQVKCAGSCVDANTDESNCGCCGNTCASGKTCTSGVCGGSIAPFQLTATWEQAQDAQLLIRTPSGELVSYEAGITGARVAGGEDAAPQRGTYDVCRRTTSFETKHGDDSPVPYTLTVKRPGQPSRLLRGTIVGADAEATCHPGHPSFIESISYP
ncbi:EGF domain-containing protein [Myxococcus qinghaiensis]|uniref:EGF domain-containing protein n=1 Tax=Myxococcus qinghaiensis TaxID=2906758 RepID=UPI0020A6ECFB|nr:EGF domain-containing protein [Myxococcus qinghaiensis]MCP3166344.1 hypothetical protein [Myxococcus qinghaiensis]